MASIHIDAQPQAANGPNLNQTQSPSKFDEVERVRQRMSGLRKHHEESMEIYNATQPRINEEIHEETLKYLKSGQVNGAKTKSQKPRAPKRQRRTANNNNNESNSSTCSTNGTNHPAVVQTTPNVTSTTNGLPPQTQIQQAPPSSQGIVHQQGHMQHITLYPPRIQQQTMHMQQHPQQIQPQQQQQQHYSMYQQPQQPTMQNQHQYQTQHQQPQQMYPQQQQMQPSSQVHPRQMEHSQYVSQLHQEGQQQSRNFAQHHNGNHNPQPHPQPYSHPHHLQHHHQQSHISLAPFTSLPNDLDLTLQAGLECDVDSLIKHEMSVEGQLDFNHDLLLKLDNRCQLHHQ